MASKDNQYKNHIILAQRTELTEYHIYTKLVEITRDKKNKDILQNIANDELKHHNFWKTISEKKVQPYKMRIMSYYMICRILGLTFGIKLMEYREIDAQKLYRKIAESNPKIKEKINTLIQEEEEHEKKLINLIIEDRFTYIGSMVLGLNDALVELTGALAGLTLALENPRIIAMVGLITGIAASLSMSASEYLSLKAESSEKKPIKGAFYTGIAYIITVLLLIIPFLIIDNVFISLTSSIIIGIGIIAFFTFYRAIAQNTNFKKQFIEMATLSLSVAVISFIFGSIIKKIFEI